MSINRLSSPVRFGGIHVVDSRRDKGAVTTDLVLDESDLALVPEPLQRFIEYHTPRARIRLTINPDNKVIGQRLQSFAGSTSSVSDRGSEEMELSTADLKPLALRLKEATDSFSGPKAVDGAILEKSGSKTVINVTGPITSPGLRERTRTFATRLNTLG